jgi:hypothetical protein
LRSSQNPLSWPRTRFIFSALVLTQSVGFGALTSFIPGIFIWSCVTPFLVIILLSPCGFSVLILDSSSVLFHLGVLVQFVQFVVSYCDCAHHIPGSFNLCTCFSLGLSAFLGGIY